MASLGCAWLVVGCSILNSFGDVVPETTKADAGSGLDAEASTEEFDASTPAAPPGVVVVAGTLRGDSGETPVLSALSPSTGLELERAREDIKVAAVIFDPSRGTGRDLFYVFENRGEGAIPLPTDEVVLQVRTLNRRTGEWIVLSRLKVPPLVSHVYAVALQERLVYVAYAPQTDGSVAYSLVVVNTSNPLSPEPSYTAPITLPSGMSAVPGPGGGGGNLAVYGRRSLGAGQSALTITTALVPATANEPVKFTAPRDLGTGGGGVTVAQGALLNGGPFFVAGIRNADGGVASLGAYRPQDGETIGPLGAFSVAGGDLKRLAISECQRLAFVVEGNDDLFVRAVPLGLEEYTVARVSTGHSGQGVYFEPYSNTVLAPFSQGERAELSAFRVGGTQSVPTLEKRETDWKPPTDLRISLVAARAPWALDCGATVGDGGKN